MTIAMNARPPTTPPAMAPALEELLLSSPVTGAVALTVLGAEGRVDVGDGICVDSAASIMEKSILRRHRGIITDQNY